MIIVTIQANHSGLNTRIVLRRVKHILKLQRHADRLQYKIRSVKLDELVGPSRPLDERKRARAYWSMCCDAGADVS